MIQEYAQLMSTAHRVLDGQLVTLKLNKDYFNNLKMLGWKGKDQKKAYLLSGEELYFCKTELKWKISNKKALAATHINHPSAIWTRSSDKNYQWLYSLFVALSKEKLLRYPNGPNKTFDQYSEFLQHHPKNISIGSFTQPTLAMPVKYHQDDHVEAYRNFYVGEKSKFSKWTARNIPGWVIVKHMKKHIESFKNEDVDV